MKRFSAVLSVACFLCLAIGCSARSGTADVRVLSVGRAERASSGEDYLVIPLRVEVRTSSSRSVAVPYWDFLAAFYSLELRTGSTTCTFPRKPLGLTPDFETKFDLRPREAVAETFLLPVLSPHLTREANVRKDAETSSLSYWLSTQIEWQKPPLFGGSRKLTVHGEGDILIGPAGVHPSLLPTR